MAPTRPRANSRSVSFGDVEEQIYDNTVHDDEDGEYDDDYYQEGDTSYNNQNNEEEQEEEVVEEDNDQEQQQHDGELGQEDGEEGAASSASSAGRNKKDGAAKKSALRNNNNNPTSTSAVGSSKLMCPNCGSRDIEQHDASGASICTECGVVVEENAIVSAVEFVEGSGGSSSMVGQFVSATSSKAYTGGSSGMGGSMMRGGRYGFSKDSRETTLANGRRRIQDVASRLRLGSHYVDAAHRLFTVAVEKNFVQGRRTTHVVAATLYIACRIEKSQHMLIDFSDALQVNVYTLGTTFLKFRRLLGLKLEIIDPALYVYRFAAHLDLDDKANAVALTALRLVGRMKRDWIVAGRRPAGICAAALLIAARAHGFSKHHQDVTRILRVCGLTVTNRVREFEQTPSAALTLTQFGQVELDKESDPPIYTKNKILEARAKAIQQNNIALLTSGALDDPLGGKRATRWRDLGRKMSDKKVELQALYESIEKELTSGSSRQQPKLLENGEAEDTNENENNDSNEKDKDSNEADKNNEDEDDDDKKTGGDQATSKDQAADDSKSSADDPSSQQLALRSESQLVVVDGNPQWSAAYPKGKYGRDIILPDHATAEEMQESLVPVEAKLSLSEWKEEMPDKITEEIDNMFRSDEEIAQKEVIFNKINKDYLETQERKESERLTSEAAEKDKEEEDAAQQEGHMRYLKSNKGRKRKRGGDASGKGEEEMTTEEALLAAVSTRKISRKINYDAMSAIFDDEGTFEAPQGAEEGEDNVYAEV